MKSVHLCRRCAAVFGIYNFNKHDEDGATWSDMAEFIREYGVKSQLTFGAREAIPPEMLKKVVDSVIRPMAGPGNVSPRDASVGITEEDLLAEGHEPVNYVRAGRDEMQEFDGVGDRYSNVVWYPQYAGQGTDVAIASLYPDCRIDISRRSRRNAMIKCLLEAVRRVELIIERQRQNDRRAKPEFSEEVFLGEDRRKEEGISDEGL